MGLWTQVFDTVGGQRAILGLGLATVALAIVDPITGAMAGAPPATVLIQFVLIAGPAFVLLFGAVRLPHSDVAPEYFGVVAAWTYAGPPVTVGALLFYDLQPTAGVTNPDAAVPILLAVSVAAGFAVGRYDGRARTREHELDERNRELDARNRELDERNEELERTREQLEATVDELAASNERLEQFAYAVSHDLQEPLRMVSSYLQLLESQTGDELSEDAVEYLEFALTGADRMQTLIDGLLAYSRVEAEGEPLEPVELDDVLADVRETLRLRLEDSDATVDVEELPRIRGDASQLRQVFQNLLDNAVEYSGDEPPRIRVWAEPWTSPEEPSDPNPGTDARPTRRDSAADWWRIAVRDEGIGIPADHRGDVFEMFERLHGRDQHEGTGIGLALCERIVERHGGEIWVDSEPGEYTTFSLTLPAATADAERDGVPETTVGRVGDGADPAAED